MRQADERDGGTKHVGGMAGWLLSRLRGAPAETKKLRLLEKMTLAPRQILALIEADGKRLLVATSAEGEPAIYALDEMRLQPAIRVMDRKKAGRISW